MRPTLSPRYRMLCLLRDERGVVLPIALLIMVVLMGIGLSSQFAGHTNLLTSTNLKMAAKATLTAETGVNEALYRLSRQEGQPGAIAPDLTDPFWNDPDWQVEIDFTSGDTDPTDGDVSTLLPSQDWPDQRPAEPVIMRYKKPDPTGAPNDVVFHDATGLPSPFVTITLPAAANVIPLNAKPVIQIVATGLDQRGAQRQIIAEASSGVRFPPPAPLSSGVDVDLGGASFIDGTNHDHRIYITDGSGNAATYGDGNSETTNTNVISDSPDDNVDDAAFFPVTVELLPNGGSSGGGGGVFPPITVEAYPANGGGNGGGGNGGGNGGGGGGGGVGNPSLNTDYSPIGALANYPMLPVFGDPACLTAPPLLAPCPVYQSSPRLFNQQIAANPAPMGFPFEPTDPAWVGLRWIADPLDLTLYPDDCTTYADPHSVNPHWHGVNENAASAIALSDGPTVLGVQPPVGGVWTRGVFTWRRNSTAGIGAIPAYPSGCTAAGGTPSFTCRPAELTPFPTFQEYLGLNDVAFNTMLDQADTTRADIDAGQPPLGFTYINGDYTFNNSTASPGTYDFGLLYVSGNLSMSGGQTYKGLMFIDGDLSITGNPTVLGAIMVRGATSAANTGNMTLLYSRKAAELGIQAAHGWRILSWADTMLQQ